MESFVDGVIILCDFFKDNRQLSIFSFFRDARNLVICLLLAVGNTMPFFSAEETNVVFLHFLFFFFRHFSQFLELWSVKSSLWKRLLFCLSFPVCGFVVRLVFLLMFLLFLLKGIFSSSRENSLCFL